MLLATSFCWPRSRHSAHARPDPFADGVHVFVYSPLLPTLRTKLTLKHCVASCGVAFMSGDQKRSGVFVVPSMSYVSLARMLHASLRGFIGDFMCHIHTQASGFKVRFMVYTIYVLFALSDIKTSRCMEYIRCKREKKQVGFRVFYRCFCAFAISRIVLSVTSTGCSKCVVSRL